MKLREWIYEPHGIVLMFFLPWLFRRWHAENMEFLWAEHQAALVTIDAEVIVAIEAAKLGWKP